MDPNAGELFRPAASVDLIVEKLGDGHVVEGDRDHGAGLSHQLDVLDVEQVIGRRDSETTDFS